LEITGNETLFDWRFTMYGFRCFSALVLSVCLALSATSTCRAADAAPFQGFVIPGDTKVMYVLAQAPDAPTSFAVATEVAMRLGPFAQVTNGVPEVYVMPVPSWTIADVANQCKNDPDHTVGALVISSIENDSGSFNYLAFNEIHADLYAAVFMLSCTSSKPGPAPSPAPGSEVIKVVKRSNSDSTGTTVVQTDTTTYDAVPIGLKKPATSLVVKWNVPNLAYGGADMITVPLLLFAGVGSYLALRQATTTTGGSVLTNVTNPGGYVNTTVSNSKTTNDPALPYGAALAAASIGQLGSVSLPGPNTSRVLKHAAADLATVVVDYFRCSPAEVKAGFDFSHGRWRTDRKNNSCAATP